MRFVLADEVGLGKTIEAGHIIRQLFLDQPNSLVVVCTPRTLGGQWFDEPAGKPRLRQQLSSTLLRVIDHSELSELIGGATGPPRAGRGSPGGAASDERHRQDGTTPKGGTSGAVLLLLTATPLRGNADAFLGLLHLIDPEAYALDDVEDFRRRLELRHEQASSIETALTPSSESSGARGTRRIRREL